jgi:N-acetylglucosaminyl-diphospho-decaprenol L-rhamnosyltransferase
MARLAQRVAGVVVNYRSREHTLACVAALRAQGIDEIVVVDNASDGGMGAALRRADPAALFLPLGTNLGYGAANNRGVACTSAPFVVVSNPDALPGAGVVATLADALASDPSLGVVGPRIVNSDGTRYPSARAFPSLLDSLGHGFVGLFTQANPFSRRYLQADVDPAEARTVDWVSGAWFMARRTAWDAVGGFDEAFFMFMEDVDLCWRMGRAGWAVGYRPEATVTHEVGVSRRTAPYRMLVAHHSSLLRYVMQSSVFMERFIAPESAAVKGAPGAGSTKSSPLQDHRPSSPVRLQGKPPALFLRKHRARSDAGKKQAPHIQQQADGGQRR